MLLTAVSDMILGFTPGQLWTMIIACITYTGAGVAIYFSMKNKINKLEDKVSNMETNFSKDVNNLKDNMKSNIENLTESNKKIVDAIEHNNQKLTEVIIMLEKHIAYDEGKKSR